MLIDTALWEKIERGEHCAFDAITTLQRDLDQLEEGDAAAGALMRDIETLKELVGTNRLRWVDTQFETESDRNLAITEAWMSGDGVHEAAAFREEVQKALVQPHLAFGAYRQLVQDWGPLMTFDAWRGALEDLGASMELDIREPRP